MSYFNRMESPMSANYVTVRRGFCHVYRGQTYTFPYICTTESPVFLANKAAFMRAPEEMVERYLAQRCGTPDEPDIIVDPQPIEEPAPMSGLEVADDDEELEV